jgi:hypothetical protein
MANHSTRLRAPEQGARLISADRRLAAALAGSDLAALAVHADDVVA